MDFLNKPLAQLKDLFQSMTPASRVTAGLLLVVVVVSLAYLFSYRANGPNVYLLSNSTFSTAELNAMEAAFGKAGLDQYEIEGGRIRVPRGQKAAFVAALAEHNALPLNFGDMLDKGFEGTTWKSSQEKRDQMRVARLKELTHYISALTFVESAAVFYDSDTKGGLRQEKVATATVWVKPVGANPISAKQASDIRKMVVGAFAGLKPEHVAVTDQSSGHTTFGSPDGLDHPADDEYIAKQQIREQEWEQRIRNLVSYIPGLTVTTYVELDPRRFHREEELENNPKTVPVSTVDTRRTKTREGASPGGRVGSYAQSNSARTLATTQSPGISEEEVEEQTTTQNAVSRKLTSQETVGFTEKAVRVAVGIPQSYFTKLWQDRHPADPESKDEPPKPDENELAQLRTEVVGNVEDLVTAILPDAENVQDKSELVQVSVFQDIKPGEIPTPGVSEKAIGWLGTYWSTLGMIGLGFFSLVMLRSMVRGGGAQPEAAPAPSSGPRPAAPARGEPREETAETPEPAETRAQRRLRRFNTSGASLQEELSELVNEDPDTAANILRTWIGSAS